MALTCMSCGRRVEAESEWVRFPCPGCRKTTILRCKKCKKTENPYVCPECKFSGP